MTRNNAKCTQSELEYKCEKLLADKNALAQELQQLQEAANELQVSVFYLFVFGLQMIISFVVFLGFFRWCWFVFLHLLVL